MPTRCPAAPPGDERCRICVDHRRERKTGPQFAIAVLSCSTHGVRFSLYPSGHVPYGRERVAPVTPAGDLIVASPAGGSDKPITQWTNTRFEAVADAAASNHWPRGAPVPRHATQQSRVTDASRLFTVDGGAGAVDAEVSRSLGVAHLLLRDVADFIATADVQGRAQQLKSLLDQSVAGPRALERVLALGARAGLIGRPYLWGLASGGEAGVRRVLDLLRAELELAMALNGRPTIASIDRTLVESADG
jgi:hypothetical protein